MIDIIIDFFLNVYDSIGIQGLGFGALGAGFLLFLYFYLRRRLNYFNRAQNYFEEGDFRKALSFLLVELDKNPSNKRALLMRADIKVKLGEYADAESDYYRLIYLKRSGDGIDTFEIKKRLLQPLYKRDKLLDMFKLSREILNTERHSAEALYYLALLYLGQLYYKEASKILAHLISIRPVMQQALFAYGVTLAQLNEFDKSLLYIKKAFDLDKSPLYELVLATIYYLMENYAGSRAILKAMKIDDKVLDKKMQYFFSLRLNAFCNINLGLYDEAEEIFKLFYNEFTNRKQGKDLKERDINIYDEFGKKKRSLSKKSGKGIGNDSSTVNEYFKLKEVAIEEGQLGSVSYEGFTFSSRFIDIEGLTQETRAALDLGFSMLKAKHLNEASSFFQEIKTSHPEVIGFKKIIDLINQKQKSTSHSVNNGYWIPPERESTERIIAAKKRRYELWEYLEVWEREAIRPYSLLLITGFISRRQLSPLLLFNLRRNFKLDF